MEEQSLPEVQDHLGFAKDEEVLKAIEAGGERLAEN